MKNFGNELRQALQWKKVKFTEKKEEARKENFKRYARETRKNEPKSIITSL